MNWIWIVLALVGAFAQATGAAIKKKALQTPGMNNVIGCLSFAFAGVVFYAFFFLDTGSFWMNGLTARFWEAVGWYVGLNVLAVWFMYRALDMAEFNHLMPFMTFTSLSLVVPPMLFLGEFPSFVSFGGIVLIVVGALLINYQPSSSATDAKQEKQRLANRKGTWYFLITAVCYTFAPTAQKIAVQESSVFFASFVVHALVALGFLAMIVGFREFPRLSSALRDHTMRRFLYAVLLAGAVIAVENGSINAALDHATVAYVFAFKRMMPFFAFLIGLLYFRERTEPGKKIAATALMVGGAVVMTLF